MIIIGLFGAEIMKQSCLLVLLVLVVAVSARNNTLNPLTSLPLFDGQFPSNQYTGYVNVNSTSDRNIFYWFVESENDPENDPVLLWLQGGPGCAGTWGMWVEHGPFRLDPFSKQVDLNYYRWTKQANMIFIDQPAGVGFSYAGSPNGEVTGDYQAAEDNYAFLQGFYELFPQFSTNDLWITGESYGGVYVPMLVSQIINGTDTQIRDNLKGFQVGNPVIDCPDLHSPKGTTILIDSYFFHGLISYGDRELWYNNGCNEAFSPSCTALLLESLGAPQPVDGDDLYTNYCTGNGTLEFLDQVPECESLDDKISYYFNLEEVQTALNAKPTLWTSCSLTLDYTMSGSNMLDYYNSFFESAPNLRILVYSGDVDIKTVPHPNTQMCLNALGRPLQKKWTRWTVPGPALPEFDDPSENDITAGYVEVFDTYTYATVRGAGHEVPLYQPAFAYAMFENFIIKGNDDLSA